MATQTNHFDISQLIDLKQGHFDGILASGQLSDGLQYEIKFSAKAAVKEGLHLIISFPDAKSLTPDQEVECFSILNGYARSHPLAQEFGYRYAQNFGAMLTRPVPHAHAIIPGNLAEKDDAPRLVQPWSESVKS